MSTSGAAPAGGPPSGAAGGDLAGVYPAPSVARLQGHGVSANAPGDTQALVWNAGLGLWVPTSLAIPAASATVTGPDAFGAAAGAGVSATFSRGDHDHGLPANPSAPFAAPAIALGTVAAAGASGSKIRADATIVAFDATAPVTQAFGDAAAVGAAAVTARRDHRHGMPAAPVTSLNGGTGAIAQANGYGVTGADANPPVPAVSLATVSSFIGANVNLAANTATQVTSVALGAGTWLVSGGARVKNTTAGVINADVWLGTTTASIVGALGVATATIGTSGTGDTDRQLTIVPFILVLAGATTVFLNAEATAAAAAASGGLFVTNNVATGITAVRIK